MRKSGAWIAHQCLLPVTKTPSASFSFSKVHKSPDKLLWHRVAPGPNPALPTSRHNRASDDCDSADELDFRACGIEPPLFLAGPHHTRRALFKLSGVAEARSRPSHDSHQLRPHRGNRARRGLRGSLNERHQARRESLTLGSFKDWTLPSRLFWDRFMPSFLLLRFVSCVEPSIYDLSRTQPAGLSCLSRPDANNRTDVISETSIPVCGQEPDG
jgi:hypothetical protein